MTIKIILIIAGILLCCILATLPSIIHKYIDKDKKDVDPSICKCGSRGEMLSSDSYPGGMAFVYHCRKCNKNYIYLKGDLPNRQD